MYGQPRLLDLTAINKQWNAGSNPSYGDISREVLPNQILLTPLYTTTCNTPKSHGTLGFLPRTGLDDVTFYKSNHPMTSTLAVQLSLRNIQAVILLYLKFYSPASFVEKL